MTSWTTRPVCLRATIRQIIQIGVSTMAKGTIEINQELCKGCTLCTAVCPQHVIEIDQATLNHKGYLPAVLVDPQGDCTGCGICAVICPDVCITVYREPQVKRQPAH
jgi:2-oxoglutarate ferredoxin oxidoreductase subunit delta